MNEWHVLEIRAPPNNRKAKSLRTTAMAKKKYENVGAEGWCYI